MSAAAAVAAGQLILGIIGASESAKAGRKAERLMMEGGALSQWASYANASDREALGALNASAITGAAANTAAGMREVGYANGIEILEKEFQNLQMYKMQSDEELRLHRMGERWHAGEIRARMSGTGVLVNSGSPMAYLRSEIVKGLQERRFIQTRDAYTMLHMGKDALRGSLLTVKTANINAQITEENAALQASVAMAEALADAAAMRRQGDISAAVGVANGQAARSAGYGAALSAIGNALPAANTLYQSWRPPQYPSTTTATSSAYAPTLFQAGSSYQSDYFTTGKVGF